MRKTIALMALLSAGVCCGWAQERVDAESKVLALERLWGSAVQLRDIKALDSIFDDAMVYVDIDGKLMTKAEVLADTKELSPVDVVMQSSAARSQGRVVMVTGVMRLRGVDQGRPYQRYARFLDTWLDKGDHWVCISSVTTPVRK
ncbi:MAG TPA: nuclear transport factor 2 family protein [Verrucomicrobiae bacterium]|nr:nuclear transport factor 2 family protein [Verrucomicrobiae bacterium]